MATSLEPGNRSLCFLDGSHVVVPADTCRGCWMDAHEAELPSVLEPIYDDGVITVRQDAEWAIPGFMVVGVRPHIGTLDEMESSLAARIFDVARIVRAGMRQALGLAAVQMYQEEKLKRPHFHVWMLPLWPDMMDAEEINPRIYESNIAEYLALFDFARHGDAIKRCADLLQGHLQGAGLSGAVPGSGHASGGSAEAAPPCG